MTSKGEEQDQKSKWNPTRASTTTCMEKHWRLYIQQWRYWEVVRRVEEQMKDHVMDSKEPVKVGGWEEGKILPIPPEAWSFDGEGRDVMEWIQELLYKGEIKYIAPTINVKPLITDEVLEGIRETRWRKKEWRHRGHNDRDTSHGGVINIGWRSARRKGTPQRGDESSTCSKGIRSRRRWIKTFVAA